MDKLINGIVVDASRTSYNISICLMGIMVCCRLIQGKCLRNSIQTFWELLI